MYKVTHLFACNHCSAIEHALSIPHSVCGFSSKHANLVRVYVFILPAIFDPYRSRCTCAYVDFRLGRLFGAECASNEQSRCLVVFTDMLLLFLQRC